MDKRFVAAVTGSIAGLWVTMAVAATSCTATATSLAFGTYTPGAGARYSTSTVQVGCTSGSFFAVGSSAGNSGSYSQRLMTSGSASLQYNLYTTAAYTSIWGDGSPGSSIYTGTGTGTATPLSFTIYGMLPDSTYNQTVTPGIYGDTIFVVVSF
jgi:spore coat protein U-like protein